MEKKIVRGGRLRKVYLSLEGLALAMSGEGLEKNQSLRVTSGYPSVGYAGWLFSQIGLLHMIAPYFPRVIETDFSVSYVTRRLIEKMYAFDGINVPRIIAPGAVHPRFRIANLSFAKTPKRVAVLDSGGKDSMYHMALAEERYGPENVMAVHIAGLNRGVASGEKEAAISQAAKFGFRNFRIIGLGGASGHRGAEILRSSLIFDSALVIPVALGFGATRVVREAPGSARYFSNSAESLAWFNKFFLRAAGLPIRISWFRRPAGGAVKELILRKPEWIKEVHNCFTPLCYQGCIRESWIRRTPTFAPFNTQCGSCVKCRITRLGWLLYGRHEISKEDAITFLEDTLTWAKKKRATHEDMLRGSFAKYLREACRRYGVYSKTVPMDIGTVF